MKSVFLFLSLVIFHTSFAQTQKDQPPYLTRSLASDGINKVQVQTSGGSIVVSGVTASEARIEVYINRNNNRDEATLSEEEIEKRLAEDYEFNIAVNNNTVSATARPRRNNMDWKRALNISFKVFVPQNASTELSTSGGSIALTNLSGTQNFTTSGGSLNMDKLSGKVKGRTSGGSIRLANSKDDIDLATSGGSIHAENTTGNLYLATSGGSLYLNGLNGTIKAHTSGGGIKGHNIGGELITSTSGGSIQLNDLACSLETSTSGGHIDVSIKEFGKYIKISNSGGNIDLQIPRNKGADLDLRGNSVRTAALSNFSGNTGKDELEGKLNGGGVPVNVRAGSGRVNLTFQ